MYCSNCSNQIIGEGKFCGKCGTPLKTGKSTPIIVSDYADLIKKGEELGTFWYRFGAYAIDFIVGVFGLAFIFGILFYLIAPFLITNSKPFRDLNSLEDRLFTFVFLILYHSVLLSIWSTTLGKKLFGLRVIDSKTGNKISFGQAINRSLRYIISSVLFGWGKLHLIKKTIKHTTIKLLEP